jgi:NhaP-type Na+/H+ or K+/H+ antiporter
MVFWKRLLITIAVMLVVSLIAGLVWKAIFDSDIPPYIAGVIGGLITLPVWELLKQFRPKEDTDKNK